MTLLLVVIRRQKQLKLLDMGGCQGLNSEQWREISYITLANTLCNVSERDQRRASYDDSKPQVCLQEPFIREPVQAQPASRIIVQGGISRP